MIEPGEDHLTAALREFEEEIGFRPEGPYIPLGSVRQKAGKVIHAWGCEGYFETERLISNMATVEWPPGSRKQVEFPEIDRCAWFAPSDARVKLNPAQAEFIDRLEAALSGRTEKEK